MAPGPDGVLLSLGIQKDHVEQLMAVGIPPLSGLEGHQPALLFFLGSHKADPFGQRPGLAGDKVHIGGLHVLIQPFRTGDDHPQAVGFIKIGAVCPVGGHVAAVKPEGHRTVGFGLKFHTPVGLDVEEQTLQLGGVFRMILHQHPQMGGIDLHLLNGDLLALDLHRLVDGIHLCLSGKGGVKLQLEGEIGKIIGFPMGWMEEGILFIYRLGRGAVIPIPAKHVQMEQHFSRHVAVQQLHGGALQLTHRNVGVVGAKGAGAQPLLVHMGKICLGVQRFIALAGQPEEHVHLLLVYDEVFHAGGDTVLGLRQRNGLHILVVDRIGQRPGKGHRLGQLPEAGHLGASVSHRCTEVHQYHEQGKDGKHTAAGTENAPVSATKPLFGPGHGFLQRGQRTLQFLLQCL